MTAITAQQKRQDLGISVLGESVSHKLIEGTHFVREMCAGCV